MQLITKGQNNTLVFTLFERVTLDNPYFLVRLQSRSSNVVKRFILPGNQSGHPERFDQFVITESVTENLTSGTVSLENGQHFYKIYEQASSTNLNENIATTLLEEGVILVNTVGDTYQSYDDQIIYKFPDV